MRQCLLRSLRWRREHTRLAGKAEQVEDVGLAALRSLQKTRASELAAVEAWVRAAWVVAVVASVVGWVVAGWATGNSSWLGSALCDHWAGSGQGGEGNGDELHFDCWFWSLKTSVVDCWNECSGEKCC